MALQNPIIICPEKAVATLTKLDMRHTLVANTSCCSETRMCFETTLQPKRKEIKSVAYGTSCSTRKRPRVSTGKSARFREESDGLVVSVTPRYVTKEDLQNVWYSRKEYRSFCEDSQSLALVFELGILGQLDPDDSCLRGLEANLHSSILEARRTARRKLIDVILRTQEAQRDHGISDPEMLRGLSLMLSKDACEDALKLAAYDVAEAETAMIEDDNTEQLKRDDLHPHKVL